MTPPYGRKHIRTKMPLDERKESEKVGLKLNIQKMKIMASGPITSWEIDGETVETVSDIIFLGSKITADGDCSHEIKRHLLFGRKVMTNLDSILKSRDITLPTKHFNHVRLFATLWTVTHHVPLSMGFSRQEYWSGLPFPSPRDLPDPEIKPVVIIFFNKFLFILKNIPGNIH